MSAEASVVELSEKVIEDVKQGVEDVKELVEDTVEEVKDTVKEVKHIVKEVKDTVKEVEESVEDVKEVISEIKLSFSLSKEQETIIALYYDEARSAVYDIVSGSLPTPVKVTKMIAALMKLMERVRYNNHPLKGSDKKVIVMELVHRLLKDLVSDHDVLSKTLLTFHDMAEHLLETLIDVSKNLAMVEEVASGCCALFFSKK